MLINAQQAVTRTHTSLSLSASVMAGIAAFALGPRLLNVESNTYRVLTCGVGNLPISGGMSFASFVAISLSVLAAHERAVQSPQSLVAASSGSTTAGPIGISA